MRNLIEEIERDMDRNTAKLEAQWALLDRGKQLTDSMFLMKLLTIYGERVLEEKRRQLNESDAE